MKTKETFLTIDPPEGHKYGFPKAISQEEFKNTPNLKEWCIDKGYPKQVADQYGEFFNIGISGDTSFMDKKEDLDTRKEAMNWFNSFPNVNKQMLTDRYYDDRNHKTLTGREIEHIWRREMKLIKIIPNQKQLKQFDKDLFKAYINKFSQENKAEMLQILINDLGVRELVHQSLVSTK